MGEVIFARTRHNYESYADYHALIGMSGFKEIYVDEIPREGVKENVYICTPLNGEWENGVETDARVVLWDMEYRREPLKPIPGVSDVWHMDKAQAELIGAKYVPVGGHPGLRETVTDRSKNIDAAYYGYMIPRRQRIQQEMQERGIKLSAPAAWGTMRDWMLNDSRLYVHVHQWDDIPAVPGLRMVVAAAYKLPVISEEVADAGVFEQFMLQSRYESLADYVQLWLDGLPNHKHGLAELGETLHQFLCHDYTFRKSVEAAL